MQQRLQAAGTVVVPLVEQVVSSPVEARVLRIGRRAGDRVKKGDGLLTLDIAEARLEADRLCGRVARTESENAQLRLRLEETLASLEAQIEQERRRHDPAVHVAAADEARRSGPRVATGCPRAAAAAKKSEIEIRQLEEALVRAQRSTPGRTGCSGVIPSAALESIGIGESRLLGHGGARRLKASR